MKNKYTGRILLQSILFVQASLYGEVRNHTDFLTETETWHELMQSRSEGIVRGEVQQNQRSYAFRGRMQKNGSSVDEYTLFEIGSITKVFTGILLADTVLLGKAELTDPIIKHLPPGMIAETCPAASITLIDLATHRSGLSKTPENLLEGGGDRESPYRHYTREQMFAYISELSEDELSGRGSYRYSNLGFGLLGEVLAVIRGDSYSDLLESVLFEPLKMRESFVCMNMDCIPSRMKDRFAQGHSRGGNPTAYWPSRVAGAGGVVSTAHDLLLFAEAQWSEETPQTLKDAFALAAQAHVENMGLGWHRREDGRLFHTGGTGGFRSYFSLSLPKKSAIVSLQNGIGPKMATETQGDFSELIGSWEGVIEVGPLAVKYVIGVTTAGHAMLYIPNGSAIPASALIVEAECISIVFPTIDAYYRARLENGVLSGIWFEGEPYILTLVRSPEKETSDVEE